MVPGQYLRRADSNEPVGERALGVHGAPPESSVGPSRTRGGVNYEYEQIIDPLDNLLRTGRALPQFEGDIVTVSNTTFEYIEVLHAIEKQSPITDEKKKDDFDKQMRALEDYRDKTIKLEAASEEAAALSRRRRALRERDAGTEGVATVPLFIWRSLDSG